MSDLPKGWTETTLGEICSKPQYGWTSKASRQGKIKYLRTTDISDGRIDWESVPFCELEPDSVEKYQIQKNDILVSRAGSVGISYRIEEVPYETVFASYLIRFNPLECTLPQYVEFYLKSHDYWASISEFSAGIAIPNVNATKLAEIKMPLAPLNEQKRIVEKLEKLLGKVEAVQARLDKLPAILKRFRQAVLAAACSGKLTADWRVQFPQSKEDLLSNIFEEKKLLYEKLSEKAKNSGKPKPRPFQHYTNEIQTDSLPELPVTWNWEYLVNISHIQGGVTKGRKFNGKKTIWLPYLRVANVQDGYLDLSEMKTIEVLPEDKEKFHLENGDILFTEGGDRDKLGRGTIWKSEIDECIHQNHIFRARLYSKSVSPLYISLVTKSDYARSYFFENASQTVNLASINLTVLGKVPIALPPPEEQKEIVRRVEDLFKFADQIEARYKRARSYTDKLTQSILAKAFRGELVPQDERDESAAVLLERIKAEKVDKNSDKSRSPKQKAASQSKFFD